MPNLPEVDHARLIHFMNGVDLLVAIAKTLHGQ